MSCVVCHSLQDHVAFCLILYWDSPLGNSHEWREAKELSSYYVRHKNKKEHRDIYEYKSRTV